MGGSGAQQTAIGLIAAMITPTLLILASVSLVATALVRMARVVDRARALAAIVFEKSWETHGVTPADLRADLQRHARRARYTETTIALLYAAIMSFVTTSLSIAYSSATGTSAVWLQVGLAILGTILLLAASAAMVAETLPAGRQISEEIGRALARLPGAA